MAATGLEQRSGDDAIRHAWRLHSRRLRHLVARLSHVHGGHSQRYQPPLRDIRQWRDGGDNAAHVAAERDIENVVSAESAAAASTVVARSEEHTSELQSRRDLVCRLLLEKKNDAIVLI